MSAVFIYKYFHSSSAGCRYTLSIAGDSSAGRRNNEISSGISSLSDSVLVISLGFATFENTCYLTQNGAAHIVHLLIRGFGTGAMHVVCGALVAFGLVYLWDRIWIRITGTVGLIAMAITYHGIYNILVSQSGAPALIGYFIPLITLVLLAVFGKDLVKKTLR